METSRIISPTNIVHAIYLDVVENVKELKQINKNLLPKDHKRPSVLIQHITRSLSDGNKTTVRVVDYLTITIYEKTDEFYQSSSQELLVLQDKVLSLFRKGYLRVKHRALDVTASSAGFEWDKAYVELQCSYFDLRTETEETLPLMEHLQTEIEVETD